MIKKVLINSTPIKLAVEIGSPGVWAGGEDI